MVYHILKDGSRPKDITGHVVRLEDAEPLYQVIVSINKRGSKTRTYQKDKNEVKVC
jgi:hypothetical protein